MTDAEKQEHAEKCKKVMVEHLTELGYPNLSNQEIANEFEEMWRKLEAAGLIVQGMSYERYLEHANYEFVKAEFSDITGI